MQIYRFKYVWEPFSHLKCENGSECRIGMDCPVHSIYVLLKWQNSKTGPKLVGIAKPFCELKK